MSLIWSCFKVCDNDAVDNLEPISSDTATINDPGANTDLALNISVTSVTSTTKRNIDDSSGSGEVTTSSSTCTKFFGKLLLSNTYMVMVTINLTFLQCNQDSAYKLEEDVRKVDPSFDTSKIIPWVEGPKKGFNYDGLSEHAVRRVREYFYIIEPDKYHKLIMIS